MVDRCAVIDLPPESQDDETNTNRSFVLRPSLSDFALFRVYCLSESDADTAEAALVAGLDLQSRSRS